MRRRERERTLVQPLVPLVGVVGEGGAADVVKEEGATVRIPLLETEHGRTSTRLAKPITIGNAVMTRR